MLFRSVIATLMALLLLVQRRTRTGILLLLTILAAFGMTEGVKLVVQRPRPDLARLPISPDKPTTMLVRPGSFSFPSGHALDSSAVYLSIALVALPVATRRSRRIVAFTCALALVLLIAWTRLYLCVHYLSDVCGGLAAGTALALLCYRLDRRWAPSLANSPDCEDSVRQSE